MAKDLTRENFDETIAEGVSLVDFWADWCGPCKMLGPVIEELYQKTEGQYKICKVNIDQEEELTSRYGVMSIPTVILFKDGKELDKRIGVHPIEEFENMLEKA
ncbi:MAG: thioredoxin [Oscillospiraceae bacterium]|nr:thioredoxin [Oscillospiraceae bacterium]